MALTPDTPAVGRRPPTTRGQARVRGCHRKPPAARRLRTVARTMRGDRVFGGMATASGSMITFIALIAIFLLIRAIPSLRANNVNFLTSSEFRPPTRQSAVRHPRPARGDRAQFGVRAAAAGPVAMAIAMFLTNYAPRRVAPDRSARWSTCSPRCRRSSSACGASSCSRPKVEPVATLPQRAPGLVLLFADGNVSLAGGGTIFTAGVVLAVMILPIITAVSREVFRQTPRGHIEAAQALGATQWEVVRMTVLPYGRSGIIAGSDARPRSRARRDDRRAHHPAHRRQRRPASRCSTAATRSPPRSPRPQRSSASRCRPAPISPPASCCSSLTFVVNALARAGRRRKGERRMTHNASTRPAKAADLPPRSAPAGGLKNERRHDLVDRALPASRWCRWSGCSTPWSAKGFNAI